MKFVKENWFKLTIVIILSILVGSVIFYLNYLSRIAEETKLETIKKEELNSIKEKQLLLVEEQKKQQPVPVVKKISTSNNSRITSQIIFFEEVLEGKAVDADLNCIGLALYNNVSISTPNKLVEMFPDSKESYKKKCLDSYVTLNLIRNKLIAEPELQPLRTIISNYIDSVRGLAVYALDDGYASKVIDDYDKEFDKYRLTAREELLRVQRLYNVKPQ